MTKTQKDDTYELVASPARVCSDRQDVNLSVVEQLHAVRNHATNIGQTVVREYIGKAGSGRIDCPQFRRVLDAATARASPSSQLVASAGQNSSRDPSQNGKYSVSSALADYCVVTGR